MTIPQSFGDRDQALAFIARAQADRARATASLGELPGLAAELDDLAQPWLRTLRVVLAGGAIVGACCIEWDVQVAAAWVQGPWMDPGVDLEVGESLIDAELAQLPASVTKAELCGYVENAQLAELARRRGWEPTRVHHAFTVPIDVVAGWHESIEVRPMAPSDLDVVRALHAREFPHTYASAQELLDEYTTVVVERAGQVVAYAAGRIQADGQAYVDFLAVDRMWRGEGIGQALLTALGRRLIRRGRPDILHLTVDEQRAPARSLYERLGMHIDASIRAYRSPEGALHA